MVQADRVIGADEDHQYRGALRVEGKIVGPARAERGVYLEAGLAQPRPGPGRERRIVDQRGLAFVEGHRGVTAMSLAGVLGDLAQRRAQGRPVGGLQRAQRAESPGRRGDHVRRLPGLEDPHRDDRRMGRVGAAADDLLQRQHDLAEHGHRIERHVGVARVPAEALDDYLEVVG
jgi:hypothetical protein